MGLTRGYSKTMIIVRKKGFYRASRIKVYRKFMALKKLTEALQEDHTIHVDVIPFQDFTKYDMRKEAKRAGYDLEKAQDLIGF